MIFGLKSVGFGVTDFWDADVEDAGQDDVKMDVDCLRAPQDHLGIADMARIVEDQFMLRGVPSVPDAGRGGRCMGL